MPDEPYHKALRFLIQCWQGHGFRTNGSKVGWKNDVQGRERAYALWNWYRLPEWIIDIAERLRMVQIENRPALEVITAMFLCTLILRMFWVPEPGNSINMRCQILTTKNC